MQEPASAEPRVHFGRAVDVYGWRSLGSRAIEVHRRDVLVGPRALASLPEGCRLLNADPDTGRKRVLIEAESASESFVKVLQRLEGTAEPLADRVPCDATLRISWPAPDTTATKGDREVELFDAEGQTIAVVRTDRSGAVLLDPVIRGSHVLRLGHSRENGLPDSAMRLRLRCDGREHTHQFTAAGRLHDPEPPRLVGELPLRLERVDRRDEATQILTLFVGGLRHAVDRGDVLRVLDARTGALVAVLEVSNDVPLVGIEKAQRAHVVVSSQRDAKGDDVLEQLDPSNLPDFPPLSGAEREAFLRASAPKVVLVVTFEPEDGDDPANFVSLGGREVLDTFDQRVEVTPHTALSVRFSTPVDAATLSALRMFDDRKREEVPLRILADDENGRAFRVLPPFGFRMDSAIRAFVRDELQKPVAQRRPVYRFEVQGGPDGVKARSGVPMGVGLDFGFLLDPTAADNLVHFGFIR